MEIGNCGFCVLGLGLGLGLRSPILYFPCEFTSSRRRSGRLSQLTRPLMFPVLGTQSERHQALNCIRCMFQLMCDLHNVPKKNVWERISSFACRHTNNITFDARAADWTYL